MPGARSIGALRLFFCGELRPPWGLEICNGAAALAAGRSRNCSLWFLHAALHCTSYFCCTTLSAVRASIEADADAARCVVSRRSAVSSVRSGAASAPQGRHSNASSSSIVPAAATDAAVVVAVVAVVAVGAVVALGVRVACEITFSITTHSHTHSLITRKFLLAHSTHSLTHSFTHSLTRHTQAATHTLHSLTHHSLRARHSLHSHYQFTRTSRSRRRWRRWRSRRSRRSHAHADA